MNDRRTTTNAAADASNDALLLLRELHPTLAGLIAITSGEHGRGFSVHYIPEIHEQLPEILEGLAAAIREGNGHHVMLGEQELGLPAQDHQVVTRKTWNHVQDE